jgi:hypothetical protein
MKNLFLLFFCFLLATISFAQTPQTELKRTVFEPPKTINGFKVRWATLSKGKYQEVFTNDTIQQIGAVLFNRVTGEVVGEVEKDSLYFPASVSSRWWSVAPLAAKMPEQLPYNYAFNNPIKYIAPDGRLPILPLLLKAGANGAADFLAQAAMNYYFSKDTGNINAAIEKVNWYQVGRSSAEGLISWKTPGGKLERAAATATGDVLVNDFNEGENYSAEKAFQDFAVGFIGDLAGGGLGESTAKYGTKPVAYSLQLDLLYAAIFLNLLILP